MKALLMIVLVISLSSAGEFERKLTLFFEEDSVFTCSLTVKCSVASSDIYALFEKDSTALLLPGAADSVYLSENEKGDIEVISLFKAFGYRAKAVTQKETTRDSLRITMNVISFTHNWTSVPKVVEGKSVYHFEKKGNGTVLNYSQKVKVDRKLGFLQRFLVRWQLKPLGKQIIQVCDSITEK